MWGVAKRRNEHRGRFRVGQHCADTAAASGNADILARQRQQCAGERDDFLRNCRRVDLLHAGWLAADDRLQHFTAARSIWHPRARFGRWPLQMAGLPSVAAVAYYGPPAGAGQRAGDAKREHEFSNRAGGDIQRGAGNERELCGR